MTVEADEAAVPWQVLERRELLRRDPWLAVSTERVRLPDGRVIEDYHRIRLQDIAVVLAVDERNRLLVFRGYRHGPGQSCLTLPGGAIDPGETPLEAAGRELREESGLAAGRWRTLPAAVTNANYHCNTEHYFLARDLRRIGAPDHGDLETARMEWFGPGEARAALDNAEAPLILGVLCGFLHYLRLAAIDG